jgi:hypothetical protein
MAEKEACGRTVVIPVDGSENASAAFECKLLSLFSSCFWHGILKEHCAITQCSRTVAWQGDLRHN